MKIELELKNGRRRSFHPQAAKVLVARGLAKEPQTYRTRELRAESPDEADVLRSELDKRDIKYHHRAGVAKLRALLEG